MDSRRFLMTLLRNLFIVILFTVISLAVSAVEPVNINTATVEEIAAAIKGIGPKKAEAIVTYRQQHGPFQVVDDLKKVPGVGDKIVESNRDNLTVGDKSQTMPGAQLPGKPPMSSVTPPVAPPSVSKPAGQLPVQKTPAPPSPPQQ
jgi:competence protein ComEA